MMRNGMFVVVALAGVLGLPGGALSGGKGFLPYEDEASVARGQATYAEQCASCHGAELGGEPNWRQRNADGLMPAPPHDQTGHTWHHPDMVLFRITKLGVAQIVGDGYESDMPGFADILSDQQILEVLAYIKNTWPDHVISKQNDRNG